MAYDAEWAREEFSSFRCPACGRSGQVESACAAECSCGWSSNEDEDEPEPEERAEELDDE